MKYEEFNGKSEHLHKLTVQPVIRIGILDLMLQQAQRLATHKKIAEMTFFKQLPPIDQHLAAEYALDMGIINKLWENIKCWNPNTDELVDQELVNRMTADDQGFDQAFDLIRWKTPIRPQTRAIDVDANPNEPAPIIIYEMMVMIKMIQIFNHLHKTLKIQESIYNLY